jgi:hypothetical protein
MILVGDLFLGIIFFTVSLKKLAIFWNFLGLNFTTFSFVWRQFLEFFMSQNWEGKQTT